MTDFQAITRSIDAELPEIARSTIRRYLDLTDPANQAFLHEPDDRAQHQTDWHQWGILTHTRIFLEDFDLAVPRYLRSWHLWMPVNDQLSDQIDGASKWALLRIAILLHDVGKFAARTQGRHRFHFAHHEQLSAEIIRDNLDLVRLGLTERQVDYIALTAGDHFVLGLARRRAREHGGYDTAYVRSREFRELATSIKLTHPNDYVEIGVLFLGDSLAKVHPPDGPPRALSQYELNIEAAHRYLAVVLSGPHL